MGFKINTNIAALNSHANALMNNRNLDSSLAKLSSGLRINKAADDSSGMAIADSLRSQASSLGQAIANGNDAIGIIQTADKAMDEQIKILDTIKTKATQAAQDGQNYDSRKAIQADITRLLEQLDNIANQTSFNGQSLLSGAWTNKEFQVGAYSNQTIKASIGATNSAKIGATRYETTRIASAGDYSLKFNVGGKEVALEKATIGTKAGSGVSALADVINKNSDKLGGIKATWTVEQRVDIIGDTSADFAINGVIIGVVSGTAGDTKGLMVNAINGVKDQTGVQASIDVSGKLVLNSVDGRAISVTATKQTAVAAIPATTAVAAITASGAITAVPAKPAVASTDAKPANNGALGLKDDLGKLTLSRFSASDIVVSAGVSTPISAATTAAPATGIDFGHSQEATLNLGDTRSNFSAKDAMAFGIESVAAADGLTLGVTTLKGAMAVIDIAEAATKALDFIRVDLGSVQNQLTVTINNISVTQVNVKSAESSIRNVDFAAESASFSKFNILSQAGSYAMSQANAVQQNVLRLLQ